MSFLDDFGDWLDQTASFYSVQDNVKSATTGKLQNPLRTRGLKRLPESSNTLAVRLSQPASAVRGQTERPRT